MKVRCASHFEHNKHSTGHKCIRHRKARLLILWSSIVDYRLPIVSKKLSDGSWPTTVTSATFALLYNWRSGAVVWALISSPIERLLVRLSHVCNITLFITSLFLSWRESTANFEHITTYINLNRKQWSKMFPKILIRFPFARLANGSLTTVVLLLKGTIGSSLFANISNEGNVTDGSALLCICAVKVYLQLNKFSYRQSSVLRNSIGRSLRQLRRVVSFRKLKSTWVWFGLKSDLCLAKLQLGTNIKL